MIIPTQSAFCFINLSRLVLEIFRFFEKHAENLNIPQTNSGTWDLRGYLFPEPKGLETARVLLNIQISNFDSIGQ
jgi:hypothetical protein